MRNENPNANVRQFTWVHRAIQVLLALLVAALFCAHTFMWQDFKVDGISLGLLGFLLVLPFADLIRKVKFGDFEAEIGRDEVARAQAKAAIELPVDSDEKAISAEDKVRELLKEDPRLALASIRIQLEEGLKRLYLSAVDPKADLKRMSLSRLTEAILKAEVVSSSFAGALRDVIGLANRAVHGERVNEQAANDLAILGVRLVREIDQLRLARLLRPTETKNITPAERDSYAEAKYRITTVVPLVEKPARNVYLLDQEGLNELLDGYGEYAEFIVGVEKV